MSRLYDTHLGIRFENTYFKHLYESVVVCDYPKNIISCPSTLGRRRLCGEGRGLLPTPAADIETRFGRSLDCRPQKVGYLVACRYVRIGIGDFEIPNFSDRKHSQLITQTININKQPHLTARYIHYINSLLDHVQHNNHSQVPQKPSAQTFDPFTCTERPSTYL